MNKYVAKRLTVTSWTEVPEMYPELPYITLCPGFKPSMREAIIKKKRGLSHEFYPHVTVSESFDKGSTATVEDVDNWWKNQTYDLDEGTVNWKIDPLELYVLNISNWSVAVIRMIRLRNGGRIRNMYPKESSLTGEDNVQVDQVSATIGRCYTFKWRHGNASTPHMTILMRTRMTKPNGQYLVLQVFRPLT